METTIHDVLESWGFDVEKIEENEEHESPDFVVSDARSVYLIELKTRDDDERLTQARGQALKLGKVFSEHMPLIHRNRLSGIIRKAQSQLSATTDVEVDYRLIWLAAVGRKQEAKIEQFQATLYGSTNIFELGSSEQLKTCYYFRNSDFFRYRDTLDAAILSWDNSARLCLNTYSPRYQQLKESILCQHFGRAVCDPIVEENSGVSYLVDSDVDRKNTQDVLGYLCTKYKCERIMNMDMGHHSATISVPHDAT